MCHHWRRIGVNMKIKHIPNSISPYENSSYDREPEQVIENQEIIIRCRVEGVKELDSETWLHLELNDGEEATYKGNLDEMDACGNKYYSFNIGSFSSGNRIRYRITCTDTQQVVNTEWYEFEILSKLHLEVPIQIQYSENEVVLFFLIKKDTYFIVEMKLEDIIKFSTDVISELPRYYDKSIQNNLKIEKSGYTLHISQSPFRLSLDNSAGDSLISFSEGIHQLCIMIDSKELIKRIMVQVTLQGEAFYGFGEKFNRVNQKNLQHKNYVYEQFTKQNDKTYLPIPFFFTEEGYGCYYDTNYPVDFTLEDKESSVLLTLDAITESMNNLSPLYLFFGQPSDMLKQYLLFSGTCSLPPKWSFGPWMSSNGWNTQKETLEQIDKMNELKIPATVLVLEAWSDETTFYIFNDAKYEPKQGDEAFHYDDFTFDHNGKWPNPKEMSDIIHNNHIKLILWQIPIIKYQEENCCLQHMQDEQTVIEKGYCVRNKDLTPYRIPERWFSDSLLFDFTNPEAVAWWFSKRSYLVDELQVDGFKTDGGEFVYNNTSLFHNGKCGLEMRNCYPNQYVGEYHKFMEEHIGKGVGVTFSRAGYQGAQEFPIHWAGDQVSEFSEFRAQIKAGLSAGLSGIIFWGFDIAGFAGDLPSTELFLRSTAMAAFSPLMQFHSEPRSGQFFFEDRRSWNNDRSPWNMAKVNNAPIIIDVYKKYANIRMNLIPYLYNEAIYCSREGRPMLCHLIMDYPMDIMVINIEDAYMLGRSLLIAPVIWDGAASRDIYLPEGIWYDFWNGKRYDGGCEISYECPLGDIPVFVKDGTAIALNLSGTNKLGDFVGNDLTYYDHFTMKAYGKVGELKFDDDLGNHFMLRWLEEEYSISGECQIDHIHFMA